jgi:hypothetical protein
MTERTAGIEEPKTTGGNYTKLKKDGDTKLRILTSPIMGYEYFNTDDRPVRSRNEITNPRDIKPDTFTGKAGKVKQFWAMTVWNYDEECIQIWEITQQALKQQLRALAKDTDY